MKTVKLNEDDISDLSLIYDRLVFLTSRPIFACTTVADLAGRLRIELTRCRQHGTNTGEPLGRWVDATPEDAIADPPLRCRWKRVTGQWQEVDSVLIGATRLDDDGRWNYRVRWQPEQTGSSRWTQFEWALEVQVWKEGE